MKPRSLSASAVKAFSSCPARWVAESHKRTRTDSGSAANLGTAVHGALEDWVSGEHHTDASAGFNIMEKMFEGHYRALFDMDDERFPEGVDMLKDWYRRNHTFPDGLEVLSTEVKTNFDLRTSIGTIPFNYIWDRCDRLPNGDIDVVDYKTIMRPLSHDMMKQDIQVRSYALAAAIQFADDDYDRIWVTLDMLRHGDPISVSFSRDENRATWDYLHDIAEQIIAMDVNDPPERVNPLCRFCVRKTACKTLAKHVSSGTVASFGTLEEVIDRRATLDNASKGVKAAIQELDDHIIAMAEEAESLEFETTDNRALVRSRRYRNIDADMIRRFVPDEIWDEYGSSKLNMGDFDKMLKDDRITDELRVQLEQMVDVTLSSPFIITEPMLDLA